MKFIAATKVIASRPPEHQPTGTPHARAKNICYPINIKEALELEFFLLLFVISGGPSDAVRRSHSISLFAHTRWSLYLLLIPFIQSGGIFLFEEIKSL